MAHPNLPPKTRREEPSPQQRTSNMRLSHISNMGELPLPLLVAAASPPVTGGATRKQILRAARTRATHDRLRRCAELSHRTCHHATGRQIERTGRPVSRAASSHCHWSNYTRCYHGSGPPFRPICTDRQHHISFYPGRPNKESSLAIVLML